MSNILLSEHISAPRHRGRLDGATGTRVHLDPASGDALRIQVRIEQGRLVEVRFSTFGTPLLVGIASFVSESVTGCPLDVLSGLQVEHLVQSLELNAYEARCAQLVLVTLLDAVQDHHRRRRLEREVGS